MSCDHIFTPKHPCNVNHRSFIPTVHQTQSGEEVQTLFFFLFSNYLNDDHFFLSIKYKTLLVFVFFAALVAGHSSLILGVG